MPSTYVLLRQAIDNQHPRIIESLISQHPELDYNNISPNGASALWWALMPPRGKKISLDVVNLILTCIKNDDNPIVNPTQNFAGLTPRQYLGLISRDDFKTALNEVMAAENIYQAPVNPEINQHNLADFARDAQSAHNSLVTSLSRNNTIRLHQHYVTEQGVTLDGNLLRETYQEIQAFIKETTKTEPSQAQQTHFGLTFCYNNPSKFAFKSVEDPNSPEFSLNLSELTALSWLAAKEQNPELLPGGANNDKGLVSRKKAVLNILYDIATVYGENQPSCAGGACNRFGMTLSAQHKLVNAYPRNRRVDGEMAQIIILRVLGQTLEDLRQENQSQYLAVLRYLTLEEYPKEKDDKKLYQAFIESKKESLRTQLIEDEFIEEGMVDEYLTGLTDEFCPAYPFSSHPKSHYLVNMMLLLQANKLDLSPFFENQAIEQIISDATQPLVELLAQTPAFIELLATHRIKSSPMLIESFITHWLERKRLEGSNSSLITFVKSKADPITQQFAKETLLLTQFLMKKNFLKLNHPQQVKWIESLTHQEIIDLMMAVYQKHPSMVASEGFDLIPELLIHAIEFGITANLSLEKIHFKDKDLRALNLSGVNLNDAVLDNCQLPLAGENTKCNKVKLIQCSLAGLDADSTPDDANDLFIKLLSFNSPPSALTTQYFTQQLQSEGLENEEMFADTALNMAARNGHTECVKAIVESKHCTILSLERKDFFGNTALASAAYFGHADCVRAILESKPCTTSLLERAGYLGKDALTLAVEARHTECVKAIVESKHCTASLLEKTDRHGNTALLLAVYRGQAEEVKAILGSKHCLATLLEKAGTYGYTALPWAARWGKVDCVKAILESKHCTTSLLEKANEHGNTALTLAARYGYTECVKAILKSKYCTLATITKLNKNGECAAQAVEEKYPAIAREIRLYTTYLKAWESKSRLPQKIAALLTEYCNKKPSIQVQHSFFNANSSAGNSHTQEVSSLLNNYQADKINTETLLKELKELSNTSDEHPLSRYIKFIECRISTFDSDNLAVIINSQDSIENDSTIDEQRIGLPTL